MAIVGERTSDRRSCAADRRTVRRLRVVNKHAGDRIGAVDDNPLIRPSIPTDECICFLKNRTRQTRSPPHLLCLSLVTTNHCGHGPRVRERCFGYCPDTGSIRTARGMADPRVKDLRPQIRFPHLLATRLLHAFAIRSHSDMDDSRRRVH